MATLFTTADPHGRRVTCAQEWWYDHVLTQHPSMNGRHDEARRTIETPLAIYRDAIHADREVYYQLRLDGRTYLKVVVTFAEEKGTLITAYPVGRPKPGEIRLWPT